MEENEKIEYEENNIKKRKIKLEPVSVFYTSGNRIPFKVEMKRKATKREGLFILRNILGFDIDLTLRDCDTAWERNDMEWEFVDALNGYLDGGDWDSLCDSCYCYCYDDPCQGNFACFLWLVSYCQEKGIF